MNPNINLPAVRCTSCNSVIGHLIPDYYKFIKELNVLIESKHDFNKPYEMLTQYSGVNIYDLFIQPFYLYASEEDRKLIDPKAVVIYALRTINKIKPEDFPFIKNIPKYRYCCNRMFLCDSSTGFLNQESGV